MECFVKTGSKQQVAKAYRASQQIIDNFSFTNQQNNPHFSARTFPLYSRSFLVVINQTREIFFFFVNFGNIRQIFDVHAVCSPEI